MLHIPIEHADDVNKLIVIPRVVVSLAILSLLSASIIQLYTISPTPPVQSVELTVLYYKGMCMKKKYSVCEFLERFNTMLFLRKFKRKRLNLLTDSKEKT